MHRRGGQTLERNWFSGLFMMRAFVHAVQIQPAGFGNWWHARFRLEKIMCENPQCLGHNGTGIPLGTGAGKAPAKSPLNAPDRHLGGK
jgi:hypothetical protein